MNEKCSLERFKQTVKSFQIQSPGGNNKFSLGKLYHISVSYGKYKFL